MDESRTKYILLNDRVGENVEKNILAFGLASKISPTQVLRGELLEALPEEGQPQDSHKIAVVGLDRKKLRLVCRTEDLTRLSDEEANLLLAISSVGERYDIFIDRKRLDIGRKIHHGSRVLVKVKGIAKDLVGVVWYKGEVPPLPGTMFGVELIEDMGQGTSDGTFRNKKYFECQKDSGVFVALDKITLKKDLDTRSKKEERSHFNVAARLKEAVLQPFSKERNERKLSHDAMERILKIDQRVTANINGKAIRGRVRYIGEERDHSGQPYTVVGLESESRDGAGTGNRHGKQRFVCRHGFAHFVPIEAVKPEGISQEWENRQEKLPAADQHCRDDLMARSLSYSVNTAADRNHGTRKRSSSFDSAEVIKAAGESSNTDTVEFIEKQRQLLIECKNAKSHASATEDYRRGEERADSATEMNFEENHFQSTPLRDLYTDRDDTQERPIREQPGYSIWPPRNHYREGENMSYGFVNIHQQDYEELQDSPKKSKHGDDVIYRGSSQPLSRCSVHLMSTELGMERNKTPVLMADVVTDSVARPREQLDQPDEHMDIQEAEEVTEIDKIGAINSQQPADVRQSMEVGSMVEVPMAEGVPRYGVIRWIGSLPQVKEKLVAGLELEQEQTACSDGTFNGQRYFTCPSGRGFFTLLQHCRQDSRFTGYSPTKENSFNSEKAFGSFMSPVVPGVTAPPSSLQDYHCGTMRGLQGHHNSCYLDATLYSMFAFSSVFDTLLHRQKRPDDLDDYDEVQVVLKEHIVNPLRMNGFVRADRLLHLRTLLDKLGSTSGLVNEEKDPEEFLNSLLHQVLKADPFLQLKSRDVQAVNNEGAYFYQIITEKDETAKMVEVQHLLEQSFLSADLILSEVPSCLILQMPRFGSRYKMYDMILPNLELDVTHIVENVLRECSMCGKEVAKFECKRCYENKVVGDRTGLSSFCYGCNVTVHLHPARSNHEPRPIKVPRACGQLKDKVVESQKMELFAVVCIETSHYVAFVKCGVGPQAPWCFFDSMADRKGEKNGYNIPAVTPCPEALEWLSKGPKKILAERELGQMPEKARRLLGDAYLCMYQNLDMAMYK